MIKNPKNALHCLARLENTYSDGRHDYAYEHLLEALGAVGIEVDHDAIYKQLRMENDIRDERRTRKQKHPKMYVMTVEKTEEESDYHFDQVCSREHHDSWSALPHQVYETSDDGVYRYETHSRDAAVQLLRYVRSVHQSPVRLTIELK